MILIDTNVFLESALAQERAAECKALLDEVSKGNLEATVTHFTLHAICAVLDDANKVAEFLRSVESSIGFHVYETSISEEISVAILASDIRRDFDDALQLFVARKVGATSIVSFDKHFNKLEIPKREPSWILEQMRRESKN